jgi:pentatricopeptide repeat protein
MRIDSIDLLFFLGKPSQLLGFTTRIHSTPDAFLARQQSVSAQKSQSAVFQYLEDPIADWGDGAGDNAEIMDATDLLLTSCKEAPEGLSAEILDSFFPLMLWWGKASTQDGATRVEELLSSLEDVIKAGSKVPQPTYKYYTLAVDAWGKAGNPENAKRILSRMEDLGASDSTLAPTRVTYNAMMNAYIKHGDMKSASNIIESMEATSGLAPIINDYNVLLAGYAKFGHAREAEQLVKRMIAVCRDENKDDLKPDLYSYNTLLDAWAKSNEPGRGVRVQEILATLIDKHESGEFEWSPDERTFSTAMTALARSGGTIEQIEKLWEDATSRGLGFGADPYMSTALLDAYANSNSAEKAEQILEKLEKEGRATDVAYNTVLKAWKAKGNEQATEHAEKLFERMKKLDLMVDAFSYCTLIAIHANRGDRQSAERAEQLVDEMKKDQLVPNVETLNAGMLLFAEFVLNNPVLHAKPFFRFSYERMDKVRQS